MDTQKFIQLVAGGEASQAKDMLNDLLSARAFESLDIKKQEIAQTLYNNGENIEVQDTADSEDEELLTQEEFDALSEEDQELYLEALEQLDETSLMQMVKSAKSNVKTKKELHPQYSQPKYGAEMLKKDKAAGTVAYVKRPVKEEVEQLDEISLKTATKAYKARAQKAYDTEDEKEINKQSAQSGRIIKKFGKAGYKAVDSVHRQFDNR